MVDFIEIHNLLEELHKGEASAFYVFNEIKNILVEQKEFSKQESLLLKLFTTLNETEKQAAAPLLITTEDARLNRFAIYELQDVIQAYDEQFYKNVWKILYDPFTRMPQDSFEALREQRFDFALSKERLDTLIETKQWQKIAFLAKELAQFNPEDKLHYKELLQTSIPSDTVKHYHGLEVSTFDMDAILKALSPE